MCFSDGKLVFCGIEKNNTIDQRYFGVSMDDASLDAIFLSVSRGDHHPRYPRLVLCYPLHSQSSCLYKSLQYKRNPPCTANERISPSQRLISTTRLPVLPALPNTFSCPAGIDPHVVQEAAIPPKISHTPLEPIGSRP